MASTIRQGPPPHIVRVLLRLRRQIAQAITAPFRRIRAVLLRAPKTSGEAAFELYLRENGIRFRYEVVEAGKRRRPDYTLQIAGTRIKADVKDLEDDAVSNGIEIDDEALAAIADGDVEDDGSAVTTVVSGGAYDPHGRLREKVNTARAQFKEYKDRPCVLVLYTAGHGADLRSPEVMLGVMYGNYGIAIPFNKARGDFVGTEPEYGFMSGGSMLHRRSTRDAARIQNTTISAILTLREVKVGAARLAEYMKGRSDEEVYSYDPALHGRLNVAEVHYGVIVWENAFAAHPLPKGLFRGPYDEVWEAKEDGSGNVLVHRGEKLRWTLERYPDGVSPFTALDGEGPADPMP